MRIAVFSDVHGNLEALEAFLQHVSNMDIDRFICLGDLVGYNANPQECINLLRELPNLVVTLGNHDAALLWNASPYAMNEEARESIFWCMDEVKQEDKEYLSSLPLIYRLNSLCFCHATPVSPDSWRYSSKINTLKAFFLLKEKVFFVGHTHQPKVMKQKNVLQVTTEKPEMEKPIKLIDTKKYLFNCGSIGQPRTGSPKLNYLIYDSHESTVTYHNVSYDYEYAGRKIVEAGLPAKLASRLARGA